MAPRLGLEPRIYSLEGCCLIHSAIGAKEGGRSLPPVLLAHFKTFVNNGAPNHPSLTSK